jgi:tripartite-type tricarboxylate transporter receptor subunit TctC
MEGDMLKALGLIMMTAAPMIAVAAQPGADTWPLRPLRIIVPQSPGGATNLVGRLIGGALSERLGQPVIVDNRPGAATIVGMDLVAKSAPDGYTLLVEPSSIAILPSMYKKLPFDTARDFAPITTLTTYPNVVIVNNAVPAHSIRELIALAKAKPDGLKFSSGGVGVGTHLGGELFNSLAGVKLLHVPYKGGGPAITALLGGEVDIHFAPISSAVPLIKPNRVRALAVSGARRAPQLPDLPTVAEAGVPGYEQTTWNGLFAPAHTPPAVLRRLFTETSAFLQSSSGKEKLAAAGVDPGGISSQEFAAFLKAETTRWGRVVREADIKPGED